MSLNKKEVKRAIFDAGFSDYTEFCKAKGISYTPFIDTIAGRRNHRESIKALESIGIDCSELPTKKPESVLDRMVGK
ncbi:MAG: hypothetical protein L6Q54_11435 [Leptospiraceae bacterium]|nr:hypothetical protein [Leptospiraceae bacterium]